jgi:hypothetical protein
MYVAAAWRAPDGRVLSDSEARAQAPTGTDPYTWLYSQADITPLELVVPGKDVWQVEVRESALLAAVGLAGMAAAGFVVQRRRPY